MIDIEKKIIKELGEVVDCYVIGKTWRVVIYDKHGAIMGKSNPFKFRKKKLNWYTPRLTLPIKRTGYIVSAFIVSGKGRWNITKKARWDSLYQAYGTEITIDDLKISMPGFL
jgi:hypothetical protein